MKIRIACRMCGNTETVDVPEDAYEKWKSGNGRIQDLMPKVHMMYREALIQSACCDCLSKLFNSPKPGEDWGEPVGECNVCGCTIYAKDGNICPSCNERWNQEE